MTPDEMHALGLRIYQEGLERGFTQVADDLIADDCIDISPSQPPGVGREGPEPLKQFIQMLHSGLSEIKVHVHELIAEGDTGVARITIEGIHTGEFFGVPATGKRISFDNVDIVHVRGGLVREHYGATDTLGLLQQLGVIPTMDAEGARPS